MDSSGGRAGHMANAPGAGGPVSTIPPAAFRQTPSSSSGHGPQQLTSFSPRPPGSLSPQALAGAGSLYASPVMGTHGGALGPNAASPQLAASVSPSSQLNRSQSLGQAAYQQYHGVGASQHHLSGAGGSGTYSAANTMSYQLPRDRSNLHQTDDSGAQYAAMSPTSAQNAVTGGSSSMLLPTINTQIPTGSFMGSAYSPSSATAPRQAYTADSPYRPRMSGGEGSTSSHSSSYLHTAGGSSSSRPYTMYEQGYKGAPSGFSSSSATEADAAASGSKQSAQQQMQAYQSHQSHHQQHQGRPVSSSAGAGLPVSQAAPSSSGQYHDALPLYNSSASQPLTSPYMPVHSPGRLGAPPRGLPQSSDRMSVEPDAGGKRRERRGTITSAETNEREAWRQQQSLSQKPSGPPPRPRGFRRVRDPSDLVIDLEPAQQGRGRRADPAGGYVSPLKAMTAYLHHTYHLVNPNFLYELSFNPRRVLTKPSKPMHNDGHDNEDSDYILYVNDFLGNEESNRYLILDVLGQGTFGQVVKCQNMKTREIVAVKVIKNKPAYFNQSMMEVTILETLNGSWDPKDEHHILRLRDTFIHAKHLCLVFELLSSNLYELIKQNSFRGLSTSLVRVFTTQLLDALTVLNEARLIHCDLKPENILLKTLQTPSIKLVDFGSACHERQVVYSYIQSRFYRSPEVLLGLPYNSAIDLWSLGCIAVELFLGLPLFPGTSEYNQICRIVEMLGLPPQYMLDQGKQTAEFFNVGVDEYGRKSYKLKSLEQYSKEHNADEQPSKRYFQATTLPDIIKTYPMSRKSGKPGDVQKEMTNRTSFVDFVSGLLNMDPIGRWTPQQAKQHPFITGEKFLGPFKPPLSPSSTMGRPEIKPGANIGKHPYGGLPDTPSKPSGSRAYQDAAAYGQHLAQQQVYNSTAQARQQQSNNPYMSSEERTGSQAARPDASAQATAAALQSQHAHAQAQAAQAHGTMSPVYGSMAAPPSMALPAQLSSGTMFGGQGRTRSNTMTRSDMVPPSQNVLGVSESPTVENYQRMHHQQMFPADNRIVGKGAPMNGSMDHGHHDGQHVVMSPTSPQALQQTLSSPSQASQNWSNATLSRLAAQQASRTYAQGPHLAGSPQSFSVVVDSQQHAAAMGRTGSSTSATGIGPAGSPIGTQVPAPPPVAYPSNSNRHATTNVGSSVPVIGMQGLSFDPYGSNATQSMHSLQPSQYQQHGSGSAFHPSTSSQIMAGQRQPSLPAAMTSSVPHAQAHMPRHSIAAPPTSHTGTAPPDTSYGPLRGMYSPPGMAFQSGSGLSGGGSIVPGMLLPSNSNPSASGHGVLGSGTISSTAAQRLPANDGFGGLSDIMFNSPRHVGSPFSAVNTNAPGGGTGSGFRPSSRSSIGNTSSTQGGLPQYHHHAHQHQQR